MTESCDHKPVVFVHAGKCSGSTFVGILLKQFKRSGTLPLAFRKNGLGYAEFFRAGKTELESIPRERLLSYGAIHGHIYFEDLQVFQGHCAPVTILRDPVRRVISEYQYITHSKSHTYHKPITDQNMTLAQFVRSDMAWPSLQTELLGGDHGHRSADEKLRLAKHRLEHEMAWFGLTEWFDEGLVLLKSTLNWKKLSYVRYNRRRGKAVEVSTELQAEIEEQNTADRQLYEFAQDLFRRRFDALDRDWAQQQLRRLRRKNRLLSFLPRIPGAKSPYVLKHYFRPPVFYRWQHRLGS